MTTGGISVSRRRPKHNSCIPSCFFTSAVYEPDKSPAIRRIELPEKACKVQRRGKTSTKAPTQNPPTPQAKTQVRARKHNSSQQPRPQPSHEPDPGSPELAQCFCSTQAHRWLDIFAGPLVVGTMLGATFYFGRLFAVFLSCICFYLIPPRRPMPEAMDAGSAESDVCSEEHKRKVVLMGLLERKRK